MASLKLYSYKTNNIIILASPNFNPGITPLNIGIVDSIIFKTTDNAYKRDNLVNFFNSILIPTLLLHLIHHYYLI